MSSASSIMKVSIAFSVRSSSSLSFSSRVSLFISSRTLDITDASIIGARTIPTTMVSARPRKLFLSFSIGRLSSSARFMFSKRRISSFLIFSQASLTSFSTVPSGPGMIASIGLTIVYLPDSSIAFSAWAKRFCSLCTNLDTANSTSPKGPTTSIGRTSDFRLRPMSPLILSDSAISVNNDIAWASASPRGPRSDGSRSLGRSTFCVVRTISELIMLSMKLFAARSSSPKGPILISPVPSSSCVTSIGRTSSPSDSEILRALSASSSITSVNHSSVNFSIIPSGPLLSS
mmetsp:Transcript_17239/g.38886  ORF Transcript_17239/g.38886 Transcript_17239/m.38886 type:complete len:289 (-) Transcript_17239:761-1627(-)